MDADERCEELVISGRPYNRGFQHRAARAAKELPSEVLILWPAALQLVAEWNEQRSGLDRYRLHTLSEEMESPRR